MQTAFDFGAAGDIADIRERLIAVFGPQRYFPRRTAMAQLVKSMISSRTKDAVSQAAFDQLTQRYPDWPALAAASVEDIEAAIAAVNFPDAKAADVKATLARVAAEHPGFDLEGLRLAPVGRALTWLKALPGVGPEVAASVLNFSVLDRPAFVADTHVLRILRRFGLVRPKGTTEAAYRAVMEATPGWTGPDLAELHILLKLLGQTVCHAKVGSCPRCPIKAQCRTAAGLAPTAVQTA